MRRRGSGFSRDPRERSEVRVDVPACVGVKPGCRRWGRSRCGAALPRRLRLEPIPRQRLRRRQRAGGGQWTSSAASGRRALYSVSSANWTWRLTWVKPASAIACMTTAGGRHWLTVSQ
jgi:hypothetical protein